MRMSTPKQSKARVLRGMQGGQRGDGSTLGQVTLVVVMCLTCVPFALPFLGWLVIYDGCMWTFGMVRMTTNKTWYYHSREEIKPDD